MHSALKQDGKPLYEYARAGITRERAARAIVIHDMRLLDWQPPDLSFDVRCSKGTYIRVLAEDLAAQLGTIAHLAALRRLGVDAIWCRTAMVLRGIGSHESGAEAGRCCCPWMPRWPAGGAWICRPPGSAPFGRGRPCPFPPRCPKPCRGRCVSMRPAWDFWVWGRFRPRAAWFRCDLFRQSYFSSGESQLEGGCRDAYNARLLKRSKLLIEV